MKVAIIGGAIALLLSACATPPVDHGVRNSRTYNKPFDAVWEDIVAHFAARNIAVKNIAKDSGVIYAEAARFDDAYADCGGRGLWRYVDRRATFNVFVTRVGGNPTVSVNTEFVERTTAWGAFRDVRCSTTGVIEAAILDAIKP